MKFSVGDAVYLVRTGEEGTVRAFIGKTMLEVDVSGVSFPVYADEVEHPYLRRFTGEGGRPVRPNAVTDVPVPEKTPPVRLPQGVYLNFFPQYNTEDTIVAAQIRLVNELPQDLRFRYDARTSRGQSQFSLEGTVHNYANIFLHTLPWDVLSAQPRLHWHLTPVFDGKTGPSQNGVWRLRPQQLFQRIDALDDSGAPSFSELLTDGFVDRVEHPLPQVRFQPSTGLPQLQPRTDMAVTELDLHADVLLGDTVGLTGADVLHLQLRALEDFLEQAYALGHDHVFVIHGIGSGLLRRAVYAVLDRMDPVVRYTDGWLPRYGFGGTQIWFAGK